MKTTLRLTGFLIVCIVLVFLAMLIFWYGVAVDGPRASRPMFFELPSDLPVVAQSNNAALTMPLFWESRQPVILVNAENSELKGSLSRKNLEGIKLIGIIKQSGVQSVLIRDDQFVRRLTVNSKIRGWLIKAISADEVLLSFNNEEVLLNIVKVLPASIKELSRPE